MRSVVFVASTCFVLGCADAKGEGSGPAAAAPPTPSSGAGASGGASGQAVGAGAGGTSGVGGSASAGVPSGGDGGPATGGASGAAASAGSNAIDVDQSAEIYDPELVAHFELELDPSALDALARVRSAADPLQDEYVHGTLRYGAEVVVDVGVRLKGEGSFRRIDRKAAFKIKIDAFVPDQTFRGLKRLTLNNMVEDPSFLAERLAYEVFREAGLPAPRCNSALVSVNGEPYGVYANVEAEDKTFLARWFASDGGNLYEEGQVDFVPGAEAAFVLETNEEANDRSDLIGLIEAVASAQPETFLEDVGARLDVRQFLRFTAAEAAVNQWDMYAYTVFFPNNFRIYADPASARFVFLPWGMDMSMKPFRDSDRPHIPLFELARRGDSVRGAVTAGLIFQRCLESAACVEAYRAELEATIGVYERAGLEARAARYFDQIREHVSADPRSEYDMDEVEAASAALVSTIRERPGAMRAELAAQAQGEP